MMKTRFGPTFGRFFLVLFVWLQCLAPLLHAHAGGIEHFGLHLPEELTVHTPGEHAAALNPHHHATDMQAIGVSHGYRIGQAYPAFADSHAPLAPFYRVSAATPPRWVAAIHLTPPPPLLSRLLPLPGAPPSR